MAYSPLHYNLLLAHMLKTPAVRELAVKHLQPAFFTHQDIGGTYAQAVIYEIISDHVNKYSVAPDPAVLMVESRRIFTQFLTPDQLAGSLRDVIEFIKLVNIADDRSVALSRELVTHMHTTCVHNAAVSEAAEALQTGTPAAEIGARLLDLERKAKTLLGTSGQVNISTMHLRTGGRSRTGIPFIDSKLGNGAGPTTGCAFGIIAPQGGGKTTFGVQLSISQALMGRPTLLVLAEEGLTLPLRRNLIACATGIVTPILEKVEDANGVADMVEAAKLASLDPDTVLAKVQQLDKNLHVLDLNISDGSMPEIETEIQNMIDSNRRPEYVYIDWAGMLADRIMSLGLDGLRFDKKYDALKAIAYGTARLATKFDIQVGIAQQMATENVKKGALATNDHYCAADCRGFTEPFKYVFTINGPDHKGGTGLSLCSIPKARNDIGGVKIVLKLNGAAAQFEDMSHKFAPAGKKFKPITASTTQKPIVPKEGG